MHGTALHGPDTEDPCIVGTAVGLSETGLHTACLCVLVVCKQPPAQPSRPDNESLRATLSSGIVGSSCRFGSVELFELPMAGTPTITE